MTIGASEDGETEDTGRDGKKCNPEQTLGETDQL